MEVLTPGHFLIGRPIEAIPDSDLSYRLLPTLRLWHLCEALVRQASGTDGNQSTLYLTSLRKYSKWREPVKNLEVGNQARSQGGFFGFGQTPL